MTSTCGNSALYTPVLARVAAVRAETKNVSTVTLAFPEGAMPSWSPGQFAMYGVLGEGECPLAVSSSAGRGRLEFTVRMAGRATRALLDCDVGDEIGFRGPYGNSFPLDRWNGKNIVFAAGGIGIAALRSSIEHVLDNRSDYGSVKIIYGARTPADLIYSNEFESWSAGGADVVLTVDPGGEDSSWTGRVALVPSVLGDCGVSARDAVAVVCGPPVMVKFTLAELGDMGFPGDRVFTTLENRMKCGVGKCGRCNIGSVYVCKCGPVFSAAEISEMPDDF